MIRFLVQNKLIVFVLLALLLAAGVHVAPFSQFDDTELPRDPVPVDAIPDIGENQQIVFTRWEGRSPRDVEDQITYPLTTALLGMPGVRTVRSFSMFGFSSIYVIFEDGVEFYWSRSRILEKLASLPAGTLPDGVAPTLGPDATALGQVYWYTLEGRDAAGKTVGGWDLHELRSIQDWTVRYALQSVGGVSEVASVGGHVQEYQIDVDPDAMTAHGVNLQQIIGAVKGSNLDVGARTMEINAVEYVVRGVGFIEDLDDLEATVVVARGDSPIRIRDVGRVALGPSGRRGAMDWGGAEVVGGVVVARYGQNPVQVLEGVKDKIAALQKTLPRRTLQDGTVSQVTIVPFYDRSTLIQETVDTLSTALWQQILITIIVVLVLLRNLRSSILVSLNLPLAVLLALVLMRYLDVDANIMSLAGIAIAIGTMVDMGIVLVENIVEQLERADDDADRTEVVVRATWEVAPAIATAVATTIVSFLPVFALTASEGKLFTPLAFTKTFAIAGALAVALIVLPALAHLLFPRLSALPSPPKWTRWIPIGAAVGVALVLARDWMPLGFEASLGANTLAVVATVGALLGLFAVFLQFYERLLRTFLQYKLAFLVVPLLIVILGLTAWLGFDRMFGHLPHSVRMHPTVVRIAHAFPGFGREFMPPFDEGQFLYMPTTMPHASFGEALDMMKEMDAAIQAIPEIEESVGKLGRADSALDPAPVSMFESVVTYKPEYRIENGKRVRQWRDHIRSPDDIWDEVSKAAARPGLTAAPKLMPIATRIVMLQTGMRAPMGIKVKGGDLRSIETAGLRIEDALKRVPSIRPETVYAERIVGKPYLEIEIDRDAIARYGLTIAQVQAVIQYAVGGQMLTRTVEGRERYPVRVRYMREERDSVEALQRVFVTTSAGEQIPLQQLASVSYERGPQVIKAEDTFLTGYITFDRVSSMAETEVVEMAQDYLAGLVKSGELELPPGVTYEFAGSYENQVRSEQRLKVLIPIALALILLLLYLQFRSTTVTAIIYSGVAVAVAGGFILIWLYNQPWFLDLGPLRELLQIGPMNMSVAVWVGFIALVGIATDDGVVMSTYLQQRFRAAPPGSIDQIRERVVEAGLRRVRPCLMTTATTILALLPVLTATGRGADVMLPMAVPSVGGMSIALITLFVVPVLYSAWQEARFTWFGSHAYHQGFTQRDGRAEASAT